MGWEDHQSALDLAVSYWFVKSDTWNLLLVLVRVLVLLGEVHQGFDRCGLCDL